MTVEAITLGTTLRAWRDRLAPEDAGERSIAVRRAAGLRREELADLAGVSVDYVVRLEQGRATSPSSQVVAALARALRLTDDERDLLYGLAGLQPPRDGRISDDVPASLLRIIGRLGDTPAGVFSADWRLLWWNTAWANVVGDPEQVPVAARSLVRTKFPTATQHGRVSSWPIIAADRDATEHAIVADLRSAAARYPGDERLAELISTTRAGNAHFAQLWAEGCVGCHGEDHKTIMHPEVGPFAVSCDVVSDAYTDQKLVIYTAVPGSEDAERLERASMGVGAVAGAH